MIKKSKENSLEALFFSHQILNFWFPTRVFLSSTRRHSWRLQRDISS